MANGYGLIGYPLGHSFSPGYFKQKFQQEQINATYTAFALPDISLLPGLLQQHPYLRGLNVTIPYKQSVIPYLDGLDNTAKHIGAVNCIKITDGNILGFNTDATGFENSLLPLLQPHHTSALILGTGGASLAVLYVLKKLGINFRFVSRTKKRDILCYEDLSESVISAHPLLINTTPLGMQPNTDQCPQIPYAYITSRHLLYDLIYNPSETTFLKKGKEKGATIKNGLEMLELQAEASWHIWND